jgi:hypothetical protein
MARTVHGVVEQHVLGQPAQPHAGAVVAAVGLALQQAGPSSCCSMRCSVGLGQPVSSTRLCSDSGRSVPAMVSSSEISRSAGVSASGFGGRGAWWG